LFLQHGPFSGNDIGSSERRYKIHQLFWMRGARSFADEDTKCEKALKLNFHWKAK
jgi:hypothetical protein